MWLTPLYVDTWQLRSLDIKSIIRAEQLQWTDYVFSLCHLNYKKNYVSNEGIKYTVQL